MLYGKYIIATEFGDMFNGTFDYNTPNITTNIGYAKTYINSFRAEDEIKKIESFCSDRYKDLFHVYQVELNLKKINK